MLRIRRSHRANLADANAGGMASLNLPSESGEYDSPVQGVKVQKLMAVVGPASVCPCNGCGVSPNIKRTQCGYQGWR